MKIVSFLPSATEMVYALGLSDRLVGRSHECNYPEEARAKPVVSHAALPVECMAPGEIDRAVAERMRSGESLYTIDLPLLQSLEPDLILTQNLCAVCAPSGNEATQALAALPRKPRVLYMSPSDLAGVRRNVLELGEAAGAEEAARKLVESMDERLGRVESLARGLEPRPRVFPMEWLDPIFGAGHWVPEMIRMAGGDCSLLEPGGDSVRVPWERIRRWRPDVLLLAPCGFDTAQAAGQFELVRGLPGMDEIPAVYAVDANSYFACPGPRLVDGVELVASLLHPGTFAWNGPAQAYRRLI